MPSAFFCPPRRGVPESQAAGTGQSPPPASLKGLYNRAQGWTAALLPHGGPTLESGVKRASTLKAVEPGPRTRSSGPLKLFPRLETARLNALSASWVQQAEEQSSCRRANGDAVHAV